MEEWKDIKGYEGLYQVSNFGRIKSLPRKKFTPTGWPYFTKEKILKTSIDLNGYQGIELFKNGKGKRYLIHRLVAMAFVEGYKKGLQVNHKDEDKSNNFYTNLEWCSRQYNCNYGSRNNKIKNGNSKVIICITTGEIFNSLSDAAKYYGISSISNITSCCKGRQKSTGKHPVTGEKLVWKYYK